MEADYVLLMDFLDESESFSNGFAMGILWNRCSNLEFINSHHVSLDNFNQAIKILEHHGYNFDYVENYQLDTPSFFFTASPIPLSDLS